MRARAEYDATKELRNLTKTSKYSCVLVDASDLGGLLDRRIEVKLPWAKNDAHSACSPARVATNSIDGASRLRYRNECGFVEIKRAGSRTDTVLHAA